MNKIHKRAKRGFTLLEILLVIAAIGILAVIVLVAINPNRQIAQVRNAERRSEINTIYKAIEQYLIDNKGYPSGIIETSKNICNTGLRSKIDDLPALNYCDGKADLRVLVPTYLAAIPVDPSAVNYQVSINSSNKKICVNAPSAELGEIILINCNLTSLNLSFNSTILGGSIINGESNGTIGIPYTGGLGQAYDGISISSTGVTGLTASLTPGSLANGAGSLSFNITGTASGVGTATFTIPGIAGATGSFTVQICPSNYIRVPGNSLYNTNNFCVMKYEAKTGLIDQSTVKATTQAAGTPQVEISQIDAIEACNKNNTEGYTGYGLINNAEWMTIARNIEAQVSNWRNGSVGSTDLLDGGLFIGNSDGSYDEDILAANIDDTQGYEGTNNSSTSNQKRTHILSNGEVIWDLSGNVWEWTSDTIQGQDKPNNSLGSLWQEWTDISNFGTLSYDLLRPSNNTWNSTQNMGQYIAGTVTGTTDFAFLRGGAKYYAQQAGVFALGLDSTPETTGTLIGFRCVMRQ